MLLNIPAKCQHHQRGAAAAAALTTPLVAVFALKKNSQQMAQKITIHITNSKQYRAKQILFKVNTETKTTKRAKNLTKPKKNLKAQKSLIKWQL